LRFLETRERSSKEVTDRLKKAGFDEEVVADTLVYLNREGFVDDRRFGASFAREKLRSGWGPRRLLMELLRKGLPRALIDEIIVSQDEDPDGVSSEGLAAVVHVVARRFGAELETDPVRGRRRAAAFLARRGHDWEAIEGILRLAGAAWGESREGREDLR
jgi:regulatory protein